MEFVITLLLCLVAAGIGCWLTYRFLRPRLQAARELDAKTDQQNRELLAQNTILTTTKQQLEQEQRILRSDNEKLIIQKDATIEQIQNLNNSMITIEHQAQEAADLFYSSKMAAAQTSFEQYLMEENQKCQDNIQNFKNEYEIVIADLLDAYKSLSNNVALMRATNDAAVAAAKRAEEMKDQQAFYQIQLAAADIKEIEMLRSVEPYLRDKEPLNKVIWKCYYEKPTTDLIGRVVGSNAITGIYKITEIATGKCYVGQAVKLADEKLYLITVRGLLKLNRLTGKFYNKTIPWETLINPSAMKMKYI